MTLINRVNFAVAKKSELTFKLIINLVRLLRELDGVAGEGYSQGKSGNYSVLFSDNDFFGNPVN